ncbi:16S rRNA (uracil(1498)-N(3))-methyltransferase [Fulvivirga sp.]|uniref:16S rRNA (uracil(1498)-N(3))-methyltransferase n=1 Tax=Fulvivirga sp. TaxID=1931237 RepID=UPI0032F02B6A
MHLFYEPNVSGDQFILNEEESRHCIKVLRKKAEDNITIIDGKGNFITAQILDAHPKKCQVKVIETQAENPRKFYIHIAIAPTKNVDRIEWFIEKSVEIGIDEISFINCQNSERRLIKMDRIEKKAISAMKQSLKATMPKLNDIQSFKDFINTENNSDKFIGFVDMDNPHHLVHKAQKSSKYLMLIGPEGDFTLEEVALALNNGFQKISLGQSRLRTETAGISACCLFNMINL